MAGLLGALALPEQLTLGYAIGRAAGGALEPFLIDLTNEANKAAVALGESRPPGVTPLAIGVAQGKLAQAEASEWAHQTGHSDDVLDALVRVATAAPDLGLAYRAWRRNELTETQFRTAARRHGIGADWLDALVALKSDVLDPVQLANAIHRGLIPDPGLLAVPPPTGTGNVPAYPTYQIDALHEAASSGIDRDRLGALVGLTGLPMGSHEAAQATFRHILTMTDYQRAIAEGNTRNEWGEAILEYSRQIPTARDFLENALRGYRDLNAALEGAALHGMTPEHATMIYQNQGRPMAVRLITQALARGGKFQPEPGEITDPYEASIVEGNLKPGYYDLARALKYTMPSPFVIRQLANSGVWDETTTRERLLWIGWNPADATAVATAWAHGSAAKPDPWLAKSDQQLWTALHKAYKAGPVDPAKVDADFDLIGVSPAVRPEILARWDAEKVL